MININDYSSEDLQDLVDKMESRITELEKTYKWYSTTEGAPPEDKRFVLAVNATNGKTYYFVLPDLNEQSDIEDEFIK